MNVNFMGIKNIGAENIKIFDITGPRGKNSILNLELTNDLNSRDLDNFRDIFIISSNKINKNFLNLSHLAYDKDGIGVNTEDIFLINDKEFKVEMDNLSIFQKIADILKKIIGMNNNDFIINKDYLDSKDCLDSFILDRNVNKEIIKALHEPQNVKATAKELLDVITSSVYDVLN